jgi:TRAP-type mannitol/chloroaromatic compound transport system permease small subunit
MTQATEVIHEIVEKHVFHLPETRLSRVLDGVIRFIGDQVSWIWVILMLVIVYQVVLRYAFGQGSIALEEIQWHLFGIGFILGLSYCFTHDRHVRVDVVAERLPTRTRAWIELFGILILLLPLAIAVVWEAIPFALRSWQLNEISPAPGGLPYRWIPKSFIIIGFALLAIAAISRLSRVTALLFGRPRPLG